MCCDRAGGCSNSRLGFGVGLDLCPDRHRGISADQIPEMRHIRCVRQRLNRQRRLRLGLFGQGCSVGIFRQQCYGRRRARHIVRARGLGDGGSTAQRRLDQLRGARLFGKRDDDRRLGRDGQLGWLGQHRLSRLGGRRCCRCGFAQIGERCGKGTLARPLRDRDRRDHARNGSIRSGHQRQLAGKGVGVEVHAQF
ncbi:MAG: hypothetical protein C0466_17500, partial [Candidatus Accumulibacter sp.]|nr:hypothetical protein [Accumulibacter sp.]